MKYIATIALGLTLASCSSGKLKSYCDPLYLDSGESKVELNQQK